MNTSNSFNKKSKARGALKNVINNKTTQQYGGFGTKTGHSYQKPSRPPPTMKGGSPASNLVMRESLLNPPMHDYVTSPRIRGNGYDGSNIVQQNGGSPASDLVMSQLSDVSRSLPSSPHYQSDTKTAGNLDSLKLYKTTGGNRILKSKNKINSNSNKNRNSNKRSSNSNKSSKSSNSNKRSSNSNKRSKSRNSNKNSKSRNSNNRKTRKSKYLHIGGASDWMSTQYSLGSINAQDSDLTRSFTKTRAPSHSELMTPSTRGLAGSGS